MFYVCYMVCLVVHICFGLDPQCGDSVSKIKGTLGETFTFEGVLLKEGFESLSLQKDDKNERDILLTYKRTENTTQTNKYRYNKENTTFEILKLQREDEGMYEIRLTYNRKERFCKYDLEVYEKITNVMINVNYSLQNDSCDVTMDCVPQTGDNVTFSWTKDQKDLHKNDSRLIISITKVVNSTYTCQAENPVSRCSNKVDLMKICSKGPAVGMTDFDPKYLIIGLFLLILIVTVAILIRKGCIQKIGTPLIHVQRPPEMPPPPNPASESGAIEALSTVYAAVQKKELNNQRQINVPSLPMSQASATVYDQVQRKKSEENYTSVYELAGPCTDIP